MSDIKLVYIGNNPDHGLTVNKVYSGSYIQGSGDVLQYYDIYCNDYGSSGYYHKSFFKTLDQVRDQKISIFLD